MGLALKKVEYLFTTDDYLEFERASETRHEYLDGEIYAMAGESDNHADITVNLTEIIASQLKKTTCRARVKDTKVRSNDLKQKIYPPKGLFSYPDLVVICGRVEYHDNYKDVVTNPRVIVEVLSKSTEVFDRDIKFNRYRKHNETLTDYVLVSQDKPQVEHFIRQDDGGWKSYVYDDLQDSFSIDSINCRVALVDVYERIEFPEMDLDNLINFGARS